MAQTYEAAAAGHVGEGVYLVGKLVEVTEGQVYERKGGEKGQDVTVAVLVGSEVIRVKYRDPRRAHEAVAGAGKLDTVQLAAIPRLVVAQPGGKVFAPFIGWDGR